MVSWGNWVPAVVDAIAIGRSETLGSTAAVTLISLLLTIETAYVVKSIVIFELF